MASVILFTGGGGNLRPARRGGSRPRPAAPDGLVLTASVTRVSRRERESVSGARVGNVTAVVERIARWMRAP